jgi:hypothetical protein
MLSLENTLPLWFELLILLVMKVVIKEVMWVAWNPQLIRLCIETRCQNASTQLQINYNAKPKGK